MSKVCADCHAFKIFGKKCWYFWEEKKTCSQFRRSEGGEPKFEGAEEM